MKCDRGDQDVIRQESRERRRLWLPFINSFGLVEDSDTIK